MANSLAVQCECHPFFLVLTLDACCALQEQLQAQAQTIERLEDTVRKQADDLDWTQTQLINTQGSLIDLENHLTTLEDLQAEAEEAAAASLQQSEASLPSATEATQPPADSARQNLPLREESLPESTDQGDDAVQSTFVDTIDSIFPPSDGDGEAGDMPELPADPLELFEKGKAAVQARAVDQNKDLADLPALHEDPYELFEKGKAAVQARAVEHNKAAPQQSVTGDIRTGQQAGTGKGGDLIQKNSPQGKQCLGSELQVGTAYMID